MHVSLKSASILIIDVVNLTQLKQKKMCAIADNLS